MRSIARCLPVLLLFLATANAAWAAEAAAADEGFVSLFNGTDLKGWDGNPDLWSVKDGAIRGETTAEKPAKGNTFCIWRGGTLKNFILKIKFRIQDGNSGVQYRSKDLGNWVVGGYQAEVCNYPGQPGFLYHERGRGSLVNVGEFVVIDQDGKKDVVGKVSDKAALLKAGFYKEKDWNEYTIVCRGNHVMQILNGCPTVELIDNDPKGRALEGILALQIHAGPPMVVEFKDIRVKNLPADYGEAMRLFNGKDLEGWTPSSDAVKDTFSVTDGVLADSGAPAGYLRTTADFADYVLRFQCRQAKPASAGVLLRMTGPDKVWPKAIDAKVQPAASGEWTGCELSLDGAAAECTVDGRTQKLDAGGADAAGKIALKADGGAVEYRNLVLIPIAKPQK